ncbi:hypothetical protein BH10PSE13_BH10PSE13_03260 [soil metagenome]
MYKETEDGEVVTHVSRTEARGGASTHVTRYVLGISLVLVIVAFAVVLGFGFFKPSESASGGQPANNSAPTSAR